MTTTHVQWCSATSATKEMRIKTTARSHCVPTGVAIVKRQTAASVEEDKEKLTCSHTSGEMVKLCSLSLFGKQFASPPKLNIQLPHD